MELHHLLPVFTFLTLALVLSHAASPPEVYWKSMLPFTPMPKSIKHILPAGPENYATADGKHNVPVSPLAGQKNNAMLASKKNCGNRRYATVEASKKNYGNRRYATVEASKRNYGNRRYATVEGKHNVPINPQLQKDHIFFLENELHPGSMLDFPLINITNTATFWPRQVVKSKPFSENKVPEILQKFSIKPKSKEAEIIENTIMECEQPAMEGEEKFCATSLESMVDFGISKLGKYVKVISTETEKETMLQKYKVTTEAKFEGDRDIVCHKENYPSALYYCHKLYATVVYSVGLKGIADGTKVKAVAVCHRDTSKWNPMHLAFQELKVKPGTNSICHFLCEDTVVWVSN